MTKIDINLKLFLQREDIKKLIKEYNFKAVYDQLNRNPWLTESRFTEMLLDLGCDPLNYMRAVPDYFLYNSSIKEFIIPSNINSIGNNAFNFCRNLELITPSNNIDSIGQYYRY